MSVAKWEPGIVPVKHELTFAPIWLGLRIVPLQFFNEDSLERIAVLVGDPKVLHPATINKTNLEVAKVLTLIDPRKPLPEAVNMQFDSGEIKRIIVSSLGCRRFVIIVKRLDIVSNAAGLLQRIATLVTLQYIALLIFLGSLILLTLTRSSTRSKKK